MGTPVVTSSLHSAPAAVLAKTCGMPGSEHAAEPTATAIRIARLVHEAGLRWFDVMASAATTPGAPDDTRGHGHRLAAPKVPGDHAALPSWKRDFPDTLATRARAPTPTQRRVLNRIVVRLTGREAVHG
jgi:hypothetical protein